MNHIERLGGRNQQDEYSSDRFHYAKKLAGDAGVECEVIHRGRKGFLGRYTYSDPARFERFINTAEQKNLRSKSRGRKIAGSTLGLVGGYWSVDAFNDFFRDSNPKIGALRAIIGLAGIVLSVIDFREARQFSKQAKNITPVL